MLVLARHALEQSILFLLYLDERTSYNVTMRIAANQKDHYP
jgi:hypothetical protein